VDQQGSTHFVNITQPLRLYKFLGLRTAHIRILPNRVTLHRCICSAATRQVPVADHTRASGKL